MRPFYAYMLRCSDGSYYCGQTDDLGLRLQQHATGDIGYTASRKPVKLVWQGEFETREGAIAFEQQIKGWSRAKKEALIMGDWKRIQVLAKPRAAAPKISDAARPASPTVRTETPTVRAELVEAARALRLAQGERVEAQGERVEAQSKRARAQGVRVGAQSEPVSAKSELPLAKRVLCKDHGIQRRAIAKAITLLESTRDDHRLQADALLADLLPHTGHALRLGISGVPGVGKSTFIEALGLHLIGLGHRVAVLTIDPSSSISGGSILGDKTRMEKLSVHEHAYIRPSPSRGTLGGVAEMTREAMLVVEAAGYDVVIVETIGVGQSEVAVAGMTDMFVLMQLPNAGDELQAIKKGVMELADLVLINKADLDAGAATRAQAQLASSLRLLGRSADPARAPLDAGQWRPQALQLSAVTGQGLEAFWTAVSRFRTLQNDNGQMQQRRSQQNLSWMWERVDAGLRQALKQDPQMRARLPAMTRDVAQGLVLASTAARELLALFARPAAAGATALGPHP